ncbi:hypothetical protein Syun_014511 [Stephania yunnanensis]|uniref:Uncharacterized protein n=1 Tax=Stephania yunnanensis TaxID=152371 RepID=A0AAP0JKJ1_9MAGN
MWKGTLSIPTTNLHPHICLLGPEITCVDSYFHEKIIRNFKVINWSLSSFFFSMKKLSYNRSSEMKNHVSIRKASMHNIEETDGWLQ